jgi:hypothetical protein
LALGASDAAANASEISQVDAWWTLQRIKFSLPSKA